jgi:DNA repair ATPase RecN
MLTELHIQNFAIIDKLDLRFGQGLIILTGETGAGKSIILDAMVMLIGGKADTTFVRTDSEAAFVEGVFQLKGPEKEAVHEVLNREELMDDPNYVVLMREVRKEGRSVARVKWPHRECWPVKGTWRIVDRHPRAGGASLPARSSRTPWACSIATQKLPSR